MSQSNRSDSVRFDLGTATRKVKGYESGPWGKGAIREYVERGKPDRQERSGMTLYSLLRPLLFALDPERAHRLAILSLKLRSKQRRPRFDPSLAIEVAGIDFPSPIGLAAGFDKDGEVADALLGLGFGFVEVGTVTPEP